MLKVIKLLLFSLITLSQAHGSNFDRKFFHYEGSDKDSRKYSISTTYFSPDESDKFNKTYKDLAADFTGKKVKTNVIFQVDDKVAQWSAPFQDLSTSKVAIPVLPKEKVDKVGAIVATVRTVYSTAFWVIIGDFNWLQSTAMLGLQSAIHYSFTYKGWGLNILQWSYKLGAKVLDRSQELHVSDKAWFKNGVKYFSGFMTSNIIGVGFMGIIAWEDFINVFSAPQVYGDIAFYSVMSLFATGGWNNFLSEQKFSEDRILSPKVIQRIYQFNGVLMAIAFPLMMNGYQSGTMLLGATGLTGILMMLKGQDMLKSHLKIKKKIGCWKIAYELMKNSTKI